MIDLEQLNRLIETSGARWQAVGFGEGIDASEIGLGYSPGAMEPSLHDRETKAFMNLRDFVSHAQVEERAFAFAMPDAAGATVPPSSCDWRNMNGSNYVTAPKDQGRCGSCVAFATAGAVESAVRISRQEADLDIDLSEAHLFFCYAAAQGRHCGNGWYMTPAMQVCEQGVVDEDCFPYTDANQPCHRCEDWQARLTRIVGHTVMNTTAEMRAWIAAHGPVVTGFTVYEDFYKYSSGIYSHVIGAAMGGHAVLVVGYDDQQRCWICKNSWRRTNWGEGGFFRIAYGECGIDATMWGVNGIV